MPDTLYPIEFLPLRRFFKTQKCFCLYLFSYLLRYIIHWTWAFLSDKLKAKTRLEQVLSRSQLAVRILKRLPRVSGRHTAPRRAGLKQGDSPPAMSATHKGPAPCWQVTYAIFPNVTWQKKKKTQKRTWQMSHNKLSRLKASETSLSYFIQEKAEPKICTEKAFLKVGSF